jgi:hypothetical protein
VLPAAISWEKKKSRPARHGKHLRAYLSTLSGTTTDVYSSGTKNLNLQIMIEIIAIDSSDSTNRFTRVLAEDVHKVLSLCRSLCRIVSDLDHAN